MTKVWKIAPGENADHWEMCRKTGCIALGWRMLKDYAKFKNTQEIEKALGGAPGDGSGAAISIRQFTQEISEGDLVVANDGRSRAVGIGTVESEYLRPNHPDNPSESDWLPHARLMNWIIKQPVDLPEFFFNIPTVHAISAKKIALIRQAYLKAYPSLKPKLEKLFRDVEFGENGAEQASSKAIRKIEQSLVEKEVFNPTSIKDARDHVLTSIVQRRGQPAFRKKLLSAYGGKCAISGCDVTMVLEAAHILEYLGPKTNNAANGLLLRADLHTLFDLRLISVDEKSMKVLVSPKLAGTVYEKMSGKKIRIPKDASCRPNSAVVAKHRKASGLS